MDFLLQNCFDNKPCNTQIDSSPNANADFSCDDDYSKGRLVSHSKEIATNTIMDLVESKSALERGSRSRSECDDSSSA